MSHSSVFRQPTGDFPPNGLKWVKFDVDALDFHAVQIHFIINRQSGKKYLIKGARPSARFKDFPTFFRHLRRVQHWYLNETINDYEADAFTEEELNQFNNSKSYDPTAEYNRYVNQYKRARGIPVGGGQAAAPAEAASADTDPEVPSPMDVSGEEEDALNRSEAQVDAAIINDILEPDDEAGVSPRFNEKEFHERLYKKLVAIPELTDRIAKHMHCNGCGQTGKGIFIGSLKTACGTLSADEPDSKRQCLGADITPGQARGPRVHLWTYLHSLDPLQINAILVKTAYHALLHERRINVKAKKTMNKMPTKEAKIKLKRNALKGLKTAPITNDHIRE